MMATHATVIRFTFVVFIAAIRVVMLAIAA